MIKSIYIHIPFCFKKCSFCDFKVHAIGKNIANKLYNIELFDKYTNALIKEIELKSKILFNQQNLNNFYINYYNNINKHKTFIKTNNYWNNKCIYSNIESIYFGGGTPMLFPSTNIKAILDTIKCNFNLTDNCEISIESDPKTFDLDKLSYLEEIGFNRLTMGVQSLDEKVLEKLNRSHIVSEVYKSIEIILSSKLLSKNFGLDLIQGLPLQNINSAIKDVNVLKTVAKHLSIYSLTLESNSSLYNNYKRIYYSRNHQDLQADMFLESNKLLKSTYNCKNSFNQYEISNFALINTINSNNYAINHESVHNKNYWHMKDYLGFGVSASSKVAEYILKNETKLSKYMNTNINNYNQLNNEDINKLNVNYLEAFNFNELVKLDYKEYLKYYLASILRTKEGANIKSINKILNLIFGENDIIKINKINSICSRVYAYFENNVYIKDLKLDINLFDKIVFNDTICIFKNEFLIPFIDEILINLFIYID